MISSFTGDYSWLSNFDLRGFTYGDNYYQTSEHAFQSMKTMDPYWRSLIRNAETPGKAKSLGRQVPLRDDWEIIKVLVMYRILVAKVSESDDLKVALRRTGDEELVEGNNWGDKFWGVCDGEGQNWLGKMWMLVRQDLTNGII